MLASFIRDDRLLISIRNSFFSESPFGQNSKVKRAQLGVVPGWVTDPEVAPGCARVRTKCAEKTSIDLWANLDPARSNDHRRVCPGCYSHLACKVLRVDVSLILVNVFNGFLDHVLVSWLYPKQEHKQREKQSTTVQCTSNMMQNMA